MPRSGSEIKELIAGSLNIARLELLRLQMLQRRIKGGLIRTWMPDNADAEYRDLLKKAAGPWLEFTRDAIAQGVVVDGYSNDDVWAEAWQENGMDGRQNGVTREAIGLGKSYILVIPDAPAINISLDDEDNDDGTTTILSVNPEAKVVMRPLSALQTWAYYDDPWDRYPQWVISRIGPVKPGKFWDSKWMFIDDQAVYRFTGTLESPSDGSMRIFEHGLSYCPVALIPNTLPPFGEPESSVERAIPIYQRVVDATFTLEMVQRYGAFPQKWMSGGTIGASADGKPLARASVDSLLHSTDPETKFGSFAAGSLQDVVAAVEAHIKHLAAVCQVPPHYLLGAVVNMSAEGIAAAESGYFRNVGERQKSIGEGYETSMLIAADILGIQIDPTDSQMHFEDVSARSLAQIADAVTKLATLKMPLDKLFAMLPGFTQMDAIEAAKLAAKAQVDAQANALAIAQAATPPVPKQLGEKTPDTSVGPNAGQPPAGATPTPAPANAPAAPVAS